MGIVGGTTLRGLIGLALSAALLTGCGGKLMDDVDAANETVPTTTPEATPSATPSETAVPEALPSPTREAEAGEEEADPRAAHPSRPHGAEAQPAPGLRRSGAGRRHLLAAVPAGDGHPREAHAGHADAAARGEVRRDRADQRPRLHAEPVPGEPGELGQAAQPMASAYAVHSFPDSTTLAQYGGKGPFDAGTDKGRLQNVGYQQSLYNLGNLRAAGLSTPMVWIDVEPVPTFVWSADKAANAAVIAGPPGATPTTASRSVSTPRPRSTRAWWAT